MIIKRQIQEFRYSPPARNASKAFGNDQVTSGGGDFPPGCFTSGSTDVKSTLQDGHTILNYCTAGASDIQSGGGDFPPGCFQSGSTDITG